MTEWYSFSPQDTLYFRGAEPAVMGESHTATMIFPPPAHTISGALRTAVLHQHGIDYRAYNEDKCPPHISDAIGQSGKESPFCVVGPLFLMDDELWLPCPYTWFYEKDDNRDEELRPIRIIHGAPLEKNTLLKTSDPERLLWVKGKNIESLGGRWVRACELLTKNPEKDVRDGGIFFAREIHTGIALEVASRRKAREGHLYSFIHARLRDNVKLIFGVGRRLPLDATGTLKLGAEQRFGEYKKISVIEMPRGSTGLYMSLSVSEGNADTNQDCVATGRTQYFGGWDLHRGFHKPMKGYFPAGSVFNKKINYNCIEL
jgi:CRISPR-associated protein Cmr3